MKKIDGKECNTAKGVSIATEFDKCKDVLFNEKIIRHKLKRIQSKSINCQHMKLIYYQHMKLTKYVLTIKSYVLDGGIRTSAYFHKGSATSCKKI